RSQRGPKRLDGRGPARDRERGGDPPPVAVLPRVRRPHRPRNPRRVRRLDRAPSLPASAPPRDRGPVAEDHGDRRQPQDFEEQAHDGGNRRLGAEEEQREEGGEPAILEAAEQGPRDAVLPGSPGEAREAQGPKANFE